MPEEIAIQVELKSLLRRFAAPERGPQFSQRLPEGATVADLLQRLDIAPKWIGFVAVNGSKSPPQQVLAEGDRVDIYPPFLSGG